MHTSLLTIFALFALSGVAPARAAAMTPQETEFFEKQVRPVLVEHCYKCHGAEKQKAELRLDSRAAFLKGSDTGPVVVPGKPDESSFIKSIRHEGDSKMPEKADKLSEAQIAALAEWVKMGIPWPEGEARTLSAIELAAKNHWAFQPVRKPEPPSIADSRFTVKTPIDAFIAAKLAEAKAAPSAPASRSTLIRRVTYDLTGLPPTTREIAEFENDPAPDAFARVVDRLLASPRYGERWGRHWLDVARYADSKGYVFQEERRYPFSYTYRDWVIGAFNSDMPYDQFLVRQIAADQLEEGSDSQAALGFLTLGRRFINNIHDIIDDRIDVISRGTLGLTTVCARCHDHKFDPISQKDYYALYGVFASSTEPEPKDLPLLSTQPPPNAEYLRERGEREKAIQDYYAQRGLELGIVLSQLQGAPVILPAAGIEPIFGTGFFTRKAKDELRELRNKLVGVEIGPNAPGRAMALVDRPQPVTPRLFIRGNPGRQGDEVPRRFLTVLSGGDPKPFTKGSGRLELARAIANKENPLTARVFVNRVWAHHFGQGLVRTPGDFGTKGELPTHPELLDWMASTFMEEGWSVKKLHRRILLSSTYQQSSEADPALAQSDPENRLVSHMHRQRLDFEAMRDSLLFVSGQLDQAMGGRPVEITGNQPAKRRTVYGFIDRQNLPGVFRTFDFASPDATSPQRHVTTVPQQALFMLNSPFVLAQARALVSAAAQDQEAPSEARIQELYERVLARRAEPAEAEAGLRYLTAQLTQPPEPEASPVWKYGHGFYDETAKRMEFHPLVWSKSNVWQGSKKFPDPVFGHLVLNATGGHPGMQPRHSAIRRWTASRAMVVALSGTLSRPAKEGDGVIGRIISSRAGELLNVVVEPGATAETSVARVDVQAGETLDFIVDPRGGDNSDSFNWAPVVQGDQSRWAASEGFEGPPSPRSAPLTAWEKYAQALLQTNEFVFVD
ncbi:MAG: PSD1 and planctomycete cytochrome C domain-containing protein [Verrucomicrobiota bacterium]